MTSTDTATTQTIVIMCIIAIAGHFKQEANLSPKLGGDTDFSHNSKLQPAGNFEGILSI